MVLPNLQITIRTSIVIYKNKESVVLKTYFKRMGSGKALKIK